MRLVAEMALVAGAAAGAAAEVVNSETVALLAGFLILGNKIGKAVDKWVEVQREVMLGHDQRLKRHSDELRKIKAETRVARRAEKRKN